MIHVPQKAFTLFKSKFTYWQKRLGLQEWRVDFQFVPLERDFAHIDFGELEDRVATVRLSCEIPDYAWANFDAAQSAKHEALHLATFRLYWLGGRRHVLARELEEEWESLVRRLESL
jgi:hypothetical protein